MPYDAVDQRAPIGDQPLGVCAADPSDRRHTDIHTPRRAARLDGPIRGRPRRSGGTRHASPSWLAPDRSPDRSPPSKKVSRTTNARIPITIDESATLNVG